MKIKGEYKLQLIRDGRIIHEERGHNGITDEGKNALLDIGFFTTAKKDWYVGLINNSPGPVLSVSDTAGSHAGWVETVAYTPADERQALVMAAASGKSIATSAQAEFTLTGTVGIYGFMICDELDNTADANTLWCTAKFDNVISGVAADVIKIDYTLSIQ